MEKRMATEQKSWVVGGRLLYSEILEYWFTEKLPIASLSSSFNMLRIIGKVVKDSARILMHMLFIA